MTCIAKIVNKHHLVFDFLAVGLNGEKPISTRPFDAIQNMLWPSHNPGKNPALAEQ